MPSISKAQELARLDDLGESKSLFAPVKLTVIEKIMVQYGAEFVLKLEEKLSQKQNVASGALADSIVPTVRNSGDDVTLTIKMLDYWDFPNEGVRGVKSSKNAPRSPYKFRNYGVPDSMKRSLKKYIQSGKARVRTVRKDVAYGIGNERKGKRINEQDTQVNTLGYLIKRFGIKDSQYFNEAFNEVFGEFESVIAESVSLDVELNITGLKLGRK
jgi:hypothetical protein